MDKRTREHLESLGYDELAKHRKHRAGKPPIRATIQIGIDKIDAYCCPVCGSVIEKDIEKIGIKSCPTCGQVCTCLNS